MKKMEKNQIEALIDQAIGMIILMRRIPIFMWAQRCLPKTAVYTAAAILRMQPTPQATAQNALRFLKQSAKVCWNLMPSA